MVKATGEEDILETTIQRLSWFAIGYNHFILIDGVLCLSTKILIVEQRPSVNERTCEIIDTVCQNFMF